LACFKILLSPYDSILQTQLEACSSETITPLLKSERTSQLSFAGQTSSSVPVHHVESNIFHRIPSGTEVTNVLVGSVDFLSKPVMAFVRLRDACCLSNVTEVPLPVRFLFVVLGPPGNTSLDYHEIGRSISTLMADQVCMQACDTLDSNFFHIYVTELALH